MNKRLHGEAKLKRDRAIVAAHRAGSHAVDLAALYKITRNHVTLILRAAGISSPRGQPSWPDRNHATQHVKKMWRLANDAAERQPLNKSEVLADIAAGKKQIQIAHERGVSSQAISKIVKDARAK